MNYYSHEYDYDYPNGINLSPNSELHQELIAYILDKINRSSGEMSRRYDSWNRIEHQVTAFVPLDEQEEIVRRRDYRRPVSIVVPVSYYTRETLLAFITGALLSGEHIFPYVGMGPEDTKGAILYRHLIQQHCLRNKIDLALNTQWSDGLTYGAGFSVPVWETKYGKVFRKGAFNVMDWARRLVGGTVTHDIVEDIIFEGNRLINIDPFSAFPDPDVPIHCVQDMRFFGFLTQSNRYDLLSEEISGNSDLFNVKYLKDAKLDRSRYVAKRETSREDFAGGIMEMVAQTPEENIVDLLHLYVKLIPSEHGLSDDDTPTIWYFTVANDAVIVRSVEVDAFHNMFPVTVCAPEFDGYSTTPVSRLEILYGSQQVVDWYISSHIANQRKCVNDRFVVDEEAIYMDDLLEPNPGGIIRLRRSLFGKNIDTVIKQLDVNDITMQNLTDANYMMKIIEKVSAATNDIQGFLDDNAPERRTAAEYRGTRSSAQSRLSRLAAIIYSMQMRDLSHILAMHTHQYASQEATVRLMGSWPELIGKEYDIGGSFARFDPRSIDPRFDLESIDSRVPGDEDPNAMMQLLQLGMTNPIIGQRLDIVKMYRSIARRLGERNIDNFMIQGMPMVNSQVLPDNQVQNDVADGKLVAV